MSTNEYWKNQTIGSFVAIIFHVIFKFQLKFLFVYKKKGPHNIQRIYVGQCKEMTGRNVYGLSIENGFPLTSRPWRQCQLPMTWFVPKISSPNSGQFIRVVDRVLRNWMFIVRDSRVMVKCGMKTNFMGFFLGQITRQMIWYMSGGWNGYDITPS